MAESACPHCNEMVSHDEGWVTGQTVTLPASGGTIPEPSTQVAQCPHCDKPIMRARGEDGVWHRDNR